jgi:hypothetical protein
MLGLRPASLVRLLEKGLITGIELPSGHHRYDRESVELLAVRRVSSTVTVVQQKGEPDAD